MPSVRPYRKWDLSGGVQSSTSRLLRRSNELAGAKNATFNSEIGSISRRNGYVQSGGNHVSATKDGLGAFVHRYAAGSKVYDVRNNSGDTNTLVSYQNGGSWTDVITDLAANTYVRSLNHLEALFLVGVSSGGTFMDPKTVDSSQTVSTTHVLNAPRAKYIAEFDGYVWLANVEVSINSVYTKYPARVYRSSVATGPITFVKGDQSGALTTLVTDSARYLKTGMVIDVYQARSETLRKADITITGVNKDTNTITFANVGATAAAASVNTGTEVITTAAAHGFTTADPIVYTTSGTVATGLTAGTTYYVIVASSTTIKLATSAANALAGTAIDISGQGTGTHSFTPYFSFSARDELWMDGRKGKKTVLWNTDYPTTETSDFFELPPGQDDDPAITGIRKYNNRLFVFTQNSVTKTSDGDKLIPISTTVGAVSNESIQEVAGWLVWVHQSGRVWAYNDNTGQLMEISRGVRKYFKAVPSSNFSSVSAVAIDNLYKVSMGSVTTIGDETYNAVLRMVYDFDANTWSPEFHTRQFRGQFLYTYSNKIKVYFQDDKGNLWIDDEGNLDGTDTIPFEAHIGRDHFMSDEDKDYYAIKVYATNYSSCQVEAAVEGGDFKSVGELRSNVSQIVLKDLSKGHDIDIKFSQNDGGDPINIQGYTAYFTPIEGPYA